VWAEGVVGDDTLYIVSDNESSAVLWPSTFDIALRRAESETRC
jgi:hypothetical protein